MEMRRKWVVHKDDILNTSKGDLDTGCSKRKKAFERKFRDGEKMTSKLAVICYGFGDLVSQFVDGSIQNSV